MKFSEFLGKFFEEMGFEVMKVNMIYNTGKYEKVWKKYRIKKKKLHYSLMKYEKKLKENQSTSNTGLQNCANDIERKKVNCIKLKNQMKSFERDFEGRMSVFFTGKAFVSFHTMKQAKDCIKNYQRKKKNFKLEYRNKRFQMKIAKALDPTDVIWENQSVLRQIKYCGWALFFILSFSICIFLGPFIIIFTKLLLVGFQRDTDSVNNKTIKWTADMGILPLFSIVILILNIAMSILAGLITKLSFMRSHSTYQSMLFLMLTYFEMINMCL